MLTRDEALEEKNKLIDLNRKAGRCDIEPDVVDFIINQIYDSFGTCIECKKYSSCIIPKLEHRYERADTFYCADYIKD